MNTEKWSRKKKSTEIIKRTQKNQILKQQKKKRCLEHSINTNSKNDLEMLEFVVFVFQVIYKKISYPYLEWILSVGQGIKAHHCVSVWSERTAFKKDI